MTDTPAPTSNLSNTLLASLVKNGLMLIGSSLAAHGFMSGTAVEGFVAAGFALLGAAWSFYNSYGRAILLAQMEVWKATAEARAVALRKSNIPDASHADIAAKLPDTIGKTDVTKIIAGGAAVFLIAVASVLFSGAATAQARKLPMMLQGGQTQRTDSTDTITAGSTKGVAKLGDVLGRVKQFTIDDLTAAAADADNQPCANDPNTLCPDPAGDCWRVLIPAVQAQQSPLPHSLGLAQAIQKARDIQRQVKGGVPDQIKTKCAIVLWDAEAALLKFGVNLAPLPKLPGLPF